MFLFQFIYIFNEIETNSASSWLTEYCEFNESVTFQDDKVSELNRVPRMWQRFCRSYWDCFQYERDSEENHRAITLRIEVPQTYPTMELLHWPLAE